VARLKHMLLTDGRVRRARGIDSLGWQSQEKWQIIGKTLTWAFTWS